MKKKNIEWFYLLGATDYKSLINQLTRSALDEENNSLSNAIGSFMWADTMEGFDHWNKRHDDAIEMEKRTPAPTVVTHDRWHTALTKQDVDCVAAHKRLKEAHTPEKEIIGYKAPYDLFKGMIKKGDVFSEYSPQYIVMYTKEKLTRGVPTEIVKTWEPVYKERQIILALGVPRQIITVKDDSTITAAGKPVPWQRIKDLTQIMTIHPPLDSWVVIFPFVKIGCSTFSKEDITKIWDEFAKLNKKS